MAQKEKILSQERLLQRAFNSARIGVWFWSLEDNVFVVNEALAKIIGCNLEELQPFKFDRLVAMCHPEDEDLINQKFIQGKQGKIQEIALRIRMKHKSGRWNWVQINGESVDFDSSGNPTAMSGTMTDISELYHSKNNLKLGTIRLG